MATAPQITQQQWDVACQGAFQLFQTRLEPYKLQKPLAIFNLMLQYALQIQAITAADPEQIYEAVRAQIKPDAHLYDKTSVGKQREVEGRPPQASDFVIQWIVAPPALTKLFPKPRASWVDEVQAREDEAAEHATYLEFRKEQEDFRKRCPGVISSFQPVHRGRVQYGAIEQGTSVLQKYLDGYEAQHQADLAKFEADKTFQAWSVNWKDVFAKMCQYVEKAYTKAEGRTPESERL